VARPDLVDVAARGDRVHGGAAFPQMLPGDLRVCAVLSCADQKHDGATVL
jgi:hypothetical protein